MSNRPSVGGYGKSLCKPFLEQIYLQVYLVLYWTTNMLGYVSSITFYLFESLKVGYLKRTGDKDV